MTPPRISEIIATVARAHEVSPQDILGRSSTRAVEIARVECYRRAFAEPKPNGLRPTKAEVARWFKRSDAAIWAALKEAV